MHLFHIACDSHGKHQHLFFKGCSFVFRLGAARRGVGCAACTCMGQVLGVKRTGSVGTWCSGTGVPMPDLTAALTQSCRAPLTCSMCGGMTGH